MPKATSRQRSTHTCKPSVVTRTSSGETKEHAGTDAATYENALRQLGLPTYRATGRDYYHQQQVVDLVNLREPPALFFQSVELDPHS